MWRGVPIRTIHNPPRDSHSDREGRDRREHEVRGREQGRGLEDGGSQRERGRSARDRERRGSVGERNLSSSRSTADREHGRSAGAGERDGGGGAGQRGRSVGDHDHERRGSVGEHDRGGNVGERGRSAGGHERGRSMGHRDRGGNVGDRQLGGGAGDHHERGRSEGEYERRPESEFGWRGGHGGEYQRGRGIGRGRGSERGYFSRPYRPPRPPYGNENQPRSYRPLPSRGIRGASLTGPVHSHSFRPPPPPRPPLPFPHSSRGYIPRFGPRAMAGPGPRPPPRPYNNGPPPANRPPPLQPLQPPHRHHSNSRVDLVKRCLNCNNLSKNLDICSSCAQPLRPYARVFRDPSIVQAVFHDTLQTLDRNPLGPDFKPLQPARGEVLASIKKEEAFKKTLLASPASNIMVVTWGKEDTPAAPPAPAESTTVFRRPFRWEAQEARQKNQKITSSSCSILPKNDSNHNTVNNAAGNELPPRPPSPRKTKVRKSKRDAAAAVKKSPETEADADANLIPTPAPRKPSTALVVEGVVYTVNTSLIENPDPDNPHVLGPYGAPILKSEAGGVEYVRKCPKCLCIRDDIEKCGVCNKKFGKRVKILIRSALSAEELEQDKVAEENYRMKEAELAQEKAHQQIANYAVSVKRRLHEKYGQSNEETSPSATIAVVTVPTSSMTAISTTSTVSSSISGNDGGSSGGGRVRKRKSVTVVVNEEVEEEVVEGDVPEDDESGGGGGSSKRSKSKSQRLKVKVNY